MSFGTPFQEGPTLDCGLVTVKSHNPELRDVIHAGKAKSGSSRTTSARRSAGRPQALRRPRGQLDQSPPSPDGAGG